MPHAASRWRRLTSDKPNHRLLDMLLHILSCGLFGCSSDFADQDNRFRLGISVEELQCVDMRRTNDRIATSNTFLLKAELGKTPAERDD